MALRAGIDATNWSNLRGDGRFARNLIRSLVELHPQTEWTLYASSELADEAPDGAAVRVVGRDADVALRGPLALARIALTVRGDELDVFLSPSVFSWFPVAGVPSVVGVHDAIATTHPRQIFPRLRDRQLWRVKQGLAVRRAGRLFTISAAARAEIAAALGIDSGSIALVPAAADPVFSPRPREQVENVLAKLGLSPERGCFVYASGINPRKGLETLVGAYAGLRAAHGSDEVPPLVVVGSTRRAAPNPLSAAREAVAAMGLRDAVLFPGFVPDEDLACLYCGATAAISPSRAEGFGLSAVEAAACEVPVVLSDIPAHRETLGDTALLFPAGDQAALRDHLERLLGDRRGTRRIGARCRAAASRFSWADSARRLHALLLEAAGPEPQ